MPAAAVHLELVFSRPETTLAVTRGAARALVDLGHAPLLEVCLPNGRRADVMALGPRGEIVICEVKSGIEDFRSDRKWGEYAPFCDVFYFAVAPEFPLEALPDEPGLLVADGFGRSDSRVNLRRFFEVDANHIAAAAMVDLFREGAIDEATLRDALSRYDIDGGKPNPRLV